MGMVTFVDETTSGGRSAVVGVEVAEGRLSLREVVRRRVFQEVAEYHARRAGEFRVLAHDTAITDPTITRQL